MPSIFESGQRDVTKHRSRKGWTNRLADNRNPREPTTFDPLAARSTSGFSFLRLLLEDVGRNGRSIERGGGRRGKAGGEDREFPG